MMMKQLMKILYILPLFFFLACEDNKASFKDSSDGIEIDKICKLNTQPSDISNYTAIFSGDVILRDAKDTVISTYHDIDGKKTVCVVSGKAYILRKFKD